MSAADLTRLLTAIAATDPSATGHTGPDTPEVAARYTRRNDLIWQALDQALADRLVAGVAHDPADPHPVIVYIELPTAGQVSWHLPDDGRDQGFPLYDRPWDGHFVAQKYARVTLYTEAHPAPPAPAADEAPGRPRVVVLCGSTRFKDDFERVNRGLTLGGHIVLAPGVFGHADGIELSDASKEALDALHFRKIDLADLVVVVNPGGYIGASTRNEIAYARRAGKPIDYLHGEAGEDFTTAGPPHPTAAARAKAAAEQLPTVGRWPGEADR